jgi:hypothetical protein
MQGFMLSFLPRYVPGSVWGYLTRGEWLARDHGIPHPVSWFGAVLEAALLCITALGVSGAYLVGTEAGVGAALMVGILTLALPGPAAMLFTRFIGARRFGIRIASPTWTGALRWTGVCLVYVGMWVLYGACTWGVGRGFFPEESWRLQPFVYASGMAWLAGFLFVIVPAGLGVRESTLEALLASAAGIPAWQGGLMRSFPASC